MPFSLNAAVPALTDTPSTIFSENAGSIVYLSISDKNGASRDSGTGFIISHDGYIITAFHLKPEAGERLTAIIAMRAGTSYPVTFIDADESSDVALWRLPQSQTCRASVTIASTPLKVFDRLLVMGFPGKSGLTPSTISVTNLYSDRGFLESDGALEGGNSGGPAFNEEGHVAAIVMAGRTVGARENSLSPIAPALALARKHGVKVAIDQSEPFADACYASCRNPSHGVERWLKEDPWSDNSGELSGGHNQASECAKLKVAKLGNKTDVDLEITKMSEDKHKDLAGQMHYTYHCSGVFKSNPVYKMARSPACGLWNQN